MALANAVAASCEDCRSISTALFRASSLGWSRASATLSTAAFSAGVDAWALMAAMMLSVFCRFLSSARSTSVSLAIGSQPGPALAALVGGASVPEEPGSPQAVRASGREQSSGEGRRG